MFSRLWAHLLLGVTSFVIASAAGIAGVPTMAGTMVEPWIDTTNREAVSVAVATEYSHGSPAMGWTGNYETCNAGESSELLAKATVRRVNFYRAMAGVPTGVTLNDEYSAKAQQAALAMSATGRLSHTPDQSFDCLNEDGTSAAANSNLYLGRIGPAAIDGYIEDPGDRNRDVGHRNTILHPPTTEVGVGHVAGSETAYPANVLWVFDEGVFDENPPVREPAGFVAWPPRGYVPPELVYPRWSFGLADAVFEHATVSMSTNGEPVELEVVTRLSLQGYVPAPILVWEPVIDAAGLGGVNDGSSGDGGPSPAFDTTYDIVIEGVTVDGQELEFSYAVTIIGDRADREGFPRGPTGLAASAVGRAARFAIVAALGPLG